MLAPPRPSPPDDDKENRGAGRPPLRFTEARAAMELVVEALKAKNVPDSVHFRNVEKTKVANFLYNFLLGEARGLNTLIITGKPGAGKTLLLNNILSSLQEEQYAWFASLEKDVVPPLPQTLPTKRIEVLQFNAMAYSQCFPLLLEIVAQIFERAELPFNKTVYKNGTYLLEMFKMHIEKFQNKIVFLLLIDELDTLAKHDQKNFELINDLLNMKDTCLVKIGISNTLDLFAKYKGTKQYVECKQMAFKPYGDEDLWGILKERMEGSLKKTRVRLEDLIDKDGMVKVCRKIQKNAFGDIRVMLSIVKDIFERKLSTLKADCAKRKSLHSSDKIGDEDYEVGPAETRITLMEAMGVVDEKYGDVQREIVKSLSLPLQTCLLALYFGMEEKNHVVKYAVFQGKLKECMEAMGVPWSHQDLEANLMSLEVYKFLKLKPLKQTKAPVAAQQCDLESNFDKKDLRGYLRDLPALALFFDREEDD